jgi:hypothetical protein
MTKKFSTEFNKAAFRLVVDLNCNAFIYFQIFDPQGVL